eukprot:366001-Chlamydomonas_euryale.AAC.11
MHHPARLWVGCRRSWAGSRTGRASGDGRATGRATLASDRQQEARDRLATRSRMKSCARPVGARRRAW